jgi:hypothetical protein
MVENRARLKEGLAARFSEAVHSRQPVTGLTHNLYRYPACFSPVFAREAINSFTDPGETVLDPFMGGGTTLVEARALGRPAIGIDINELAVFLARVKTAVLSDEDLRSLHDWADSLIAGLNLRNAPVRAEEWIEKGYQRNISGRRTWPIRKSLELALAQVDKLELKRQQEFARCVLLKTGQWALDCRRTIPSAKAFRKRLFTNFAAMSRAVKEFAIQAKEADRLYETSSQPPTLCLHCTAAGIEDEPELAESPTPKLILTSPPYPGVHVLYHRWQVQGRRETPAPYWIADSLDGQGESFYTFGSRKQQGLEDYYTQLYDNFASLAEVSDRETLVVQMVGFSDPSWQFQEYLRTMEQAGFKEVLFPSLASGPSGRLWRRVPNRRWYADRKGTLSSSKEVVLFHQLA